ncbi:MAG: hypothetical protein LQ338_001733 [Usnochroma carphineum]|nr:MAG: hypothetical protein LQ338_001733 [Usnochroma carphineum]
MYGGTTGGRTFSDDVWVLSIPSFRWISVNDTNNQERLSDGPAAGRNGHTCAMWRDSQLLVLGGIYPRPAATTVGSDRNVSVCDTVYSPIRLLDTSTYAWQTEYKPDFDAYKVPPVVYKEIGGDSAGKAVLKSPGPGFNDSRLSTIFARTLPRPHGSNGPPFSSTVASVHTSPSSTSPAAKSASSTPSTPSTHAPVVGGVVGALVALTFFLWIGWYYRRRKRSSPAPDRPPAETQETSEGPWTKPELDENARHELPDTEMERSELATGYQGHQML